MNSFPQHLTRTPSLVGFPEIIITAAMIKIMTIGKIICSPIPTATVSKDQPTALRPVSRADV